MEWTWNFLLYSIIIISPPFLLHLLRRRNNSASTTLPPGPPGWPVFGNLFDLGTTPHRTLAGLKKQYGPVVWLRLGSINTMVVLTATAATELFKNHDHSFSGRAVPAVFLSHDYHKGSVALAPCSPYWRLLRRVGSVEMLIAKRINATVAVRRKSVDNLLMWIEREARGHRDAAARGVHVAHFVFLASFNILGNLMFSGDVVDPESAKASELFSAMTSFIEWAGYPNLVDSFPWLGWVDPQGLRRGMDRDLGKALAMVSGLVKKRVKEREEGGLGKRNDFLDVLLDFEGNGKDEPEKLSEAEINIFILEMFLAGSETTSSTTEWAMVDLLRHPETMAKAKAELNNVVGPNRKMEESDIDNLQYLQAVVKETMRLHPSFPLLVPRKTIQDTSFMGYQIPKNTQVLVNAWAIGRDPECWDDPELFKPERFLGSKIDYRGQHYEFIPFGAGRRMCAGIPLAHRMVHLLLGSLLHEFEWELDGNATCENMDMKERMGIAVRKLEPLEAIPRKRRCDHDFK